MEFFVIFFIIYLKLVYVENRMLPIHYRALAPNSEDDSGKAIDHNDDNLHQKVIGLRTFQDKDNDEYGFELESTHNEKESKPCAIIVLSNMQNPNVQSLIRKYRYNSNGALIPSSVKYYIKLPQGLRSSPLLLPLNDKAFSPLGGFVRYYKEVPPIPHSW